MNLQASAAADCDEGGTRRLDTPGSKLIRTPSTIRECQQGQADPFCGCSILLARVSEEDATIYPIYLNREEAELTSELKDPSTTERRRERIERRLKTNLTAHRQIEQLAEESAGSVFVVAGENELDGIYQRVAAELRLIYSLAYASTNTSHDGKFRKM